MNLFQGSLRLEHTEDVAHNTKKFRFSPQNLSLLDSTPQSSENFTFHPGQFLSLQFNKTSWRAYSIASAPFEDLVEFVVRLIPGGVASEVWESAKKGDTFPFKGPFGDFKASLNPNARFVFCATGTGIAPFRSMILAENKSPTPRPIKLLYGGRNMNDIAYLDEIKSWAENLEIHLGFSREVPSVGSLKPSLEKCCKHCRITKFLEEQEPDEHTEFYICGNGEMVKSVNELLESQNISKERIFMERFN